MKLTLSMTGMASVILLAGSIFSAQAISQDAGSLTSSLEQGKQIAFNRKKGNCLACHAIVGGKAAGNIGPPLIAMKARFLNNKGKLRAQIYNAEAANPETSMPPFGKNKALSDDEIDKVVEFIWSL